ncbi:MAG: class I SAM-dependent methyltransferase, partial [Alphaproteobacteria bacterium]
RKDFIATDGASDETETAFVERYWTDVWDREGGPKGAYDKIPGKAEYRIMAPYIDRLPEGAKLLDGGCGLGDWTVYFSRNGHPTTGLDISRETVAKLKELFPDVDFAVGDIRRTGLASASIDGYFSWGVFEHFEGGLKPCVDEAWRLLKPGGYLFVSVPMDNLRHALGGAITGVSEPSPGARFYQWRLTRAEHARELSIVGFDVLKVVPIHKRQGVLRALHHGLGLHFDWFFTRALSAVLAPFVPGLLIAHMILAVARKPE